MEYEVKNPDFRERIKAYLEEQHFMNLMGFDLDRIEPGLTEGHMDLEKKHHQQWGLLHGGVVATIADIVAGFAAYTLVPPDVHVVTGEIKISYFKPGIGDKVRAKGWVVKPGKKLSFCEAEVYSIYGDKTKLIAKATTTMINISPEEFNSRFL